MVMVDPFEAAADFFDPPPDPYYNDPVGWCRDCIDWEDSDGLNEYQQDEMQRLVATGRLGVRGPHGIGKTTVDALLVLWFATTREKAARDWKVITTADAWRQLEQYLWPEIHKWAKRIKWDRVGLKPWTRYQLLDMHVKLNFGEAFAVASNDSARIEGAHADSLLYIVDEAKIVPGATWDSIEGAFMNEGAEGIELYLLANSTPGAPLGRFYDIHKRVAGYEDWDTMHVTLAMAIAAGRITKEAAERRRRQWGEKSSQYQIRVLGNFAADDEDAVIPLSWVEMANDRWRDLERTNRLTEGHFRNLGGDIARTGKDVTVAALRHKPTSEGIHVITKLVRFPKQDTAQTTDDFEPFVIARGTWATIDSIGLGASVADHLRRRGYGVVMFNASEKTNFRDRSGELTFVNKRSAAWWNLREMLEPDSLDPIALPPDDMLLGDLCAPTYRRVAGGRIQVESKDDIKKRLKRSTDSGDAVVQVFWPEAPPVVDSGGGGRKKPVMAGILKERF